MNGEISNWEIVAVLNELRGSWNDILALVERLDHVSRSVDPLRMELLISKEVGLSLKLHAMELVYTIGYYWCFSFVTKLGGSTIKIIMDL